MGITNLYVYQNNEDVPLLTYKKNALIQFKTLLRAVVRDPNQFFCERDICECSCCGYQGHLLTARKRHVHRAYRCPNCESRPPDRNIALFLKKNSIELAGKNFLHIASEWPLFRKLKNEPGYVGGDIQKRRNGNAIVVITAISFEENIFDFLICNHVLEHVKEDQKAMKECFRVLRTGGVGIFSVPLSGKKRTWEPPKGMPLNEIEAIAGWDHKRLYGYDFAEKLERHGFSVSMFRISDKEARLHGISSEGYKDEIFIAVK